MGFEAVSGSIRLSLGAVVAVDIIFPPGPGCWQRTPRGGKERPPAGSGLKQKRRARCLAPRCFHSRAARKARTVPRGLWGPRGAVFAQGEAAVTPASPTAEPRTGERVGRKAGRLARDLPPVQVARHC